MNRRQVLTLAGVGSMGLTASLAGCLHGSSASLGVNSVDNESVAESDTAYMVVAVRNSGDRSGTGLIRGEVAYGDTVDEQYREVTVPGDELLDVPLKFRFGDRSPKVFTGDAALAEDGEQENSDGFHDLVVVEFDDPSRADIAAGEPRIRAVVENWGEAERTATLRATVTVDDSEYAEDTEVTLSAGHSETVDIGLDFPEPSDGFSFDASVAFPEQ